MKRLRLSGPSSSTRLWCQLLPSPLATLFCQRCNNIRHVSAQSAAPSSSPQSLSSQYDPLALKSSLAQQTPSHDTKLERFRSPPPERAQRSAKLAALHARLSLSRQIPLQVLARALVDPTADPDPRFNNSSFAILGGDLLGYYCSEHLIANYPRLPIEVLWAAQRAYLGPEVLSQIVKEWGVDPVVAPGGEVDPGLLQFKRQKRTELYYEQNSFAQRRERERQALLPPALRKEAAKEAAIAKPSGRDLSIFEHQRTHKTFKLLNGDQFGELRSDTAAAQGTTTIDVAASGFVQSVAALVHLYSGQQAAKAFFTDHFLSRSLDLSKLFHFDRPGRDLLLLCKREGFEVPIARMISETGRKSAHPVFVVGVFSGRDKLGEGVGGSLAEAKTRAAVAALKSWYLYRPLDVTVPSTTEVPEGKTTWKPNHVDCGEVVMY